MIPQNFHLNQVVVSMIIPCLFSRKIEIFAANRLVYREICYIHLLLTPPSRRIKKNKMQKALWFLPITDCYHSIQIKTPSGQKSTTPYPASHESSVYKYIAFPEIRKRKSHVKLYAKYYMGPFHDNLILISHTDKPG